MLESSIWEFLVSILCKDKEFDLTWAFTGVYGPCDQTTFGLLRDD